MTHINKNCILHIHDIKSRIKGHKRFQIFFRQISTKIWNVTTIPLLLRLFEID